MIHLDTSFLIRALVGGSPEDAQLRAWLDTSTALAISAIGWTELFCGPLQETQVALVRRVCGEPVAFTRIDAERAASLFNLARRRRGTLMDCMIAAVALCAGAVLATSNPGDFRPLQAAGLRLFALGADG